MIIQNGYIIAVESKDANKDEILERLKSKPADPDGYHYLLNAENFEWELVELPPEPDPEIEDSEALDIIFGGAE